MRPASAAGGLGHAPASDDFQAIVIGAGPGGLATSRELSARGVRHVVLERGEAVGWSWRHSYESLTLHTGRHMSSLPGLSFGRRVPLFVPRDLFVAYLERYVQRFSLPVVTGCGVRRARRHDDLWILDTEQGELRASWIVLATGIMANPRRPTLAGEARFGGHVRHSVEYRNAAAFAGRRVLVVGAGNSAGEIASEQGRAGVDVTLSVRSGANVVPRELLGVPIQYLAYLVTRLPRPLRARIVALVQRATELRMGPPVLPRGPADPLDAIPLIGFHLVDAIRDGRVRVRGALTALSDTGACFADGDPQPFDEVILATGFRAAVQPVAAAVRLDGRGFVERHERVIADATQNLCVVGHNYDATGALFNIRRDAPLAARRVAEGL